jgi:hypothetical protein
MTSSGIILDNYFYLCYSPAQSSHKPTSTITTKRQLGLVGKAQEKEVMYNQLGKFERW